MTPICDSLCCPFGNVNSSGFVLVCAGPCRAENKPVGDSRRAAAAAAAAAGAAAVSASPSPSSSASASATSPSGGAAAKRKADKAAKKAKKKKKKGKKSKKWAKEQNSPSAARCVFLFFRCWGRTGARLCRASERLRCVAFRSGCADVRCDYMY